MVCHTSINAVEAVEAVLSQEGDAWWIPGGIDVEERWKAAGETEGLVERVRLVPGECARRDLDDGLGVGAERCVC